METVILIISALLLISSQGIHSYKVSVKGVDYHMREGNVFAPTLSYISGFILPVISLSNIIDIHWIFVFFINLAFTLAFGGRIAKSYLVRFSSGNIDKDMKITFILGVVTLIAGILLKYY